MFLFSFLNIYPQMRKRDKKKKDQKFLCRWQLLKNFGTLDINSFFPVVEAICFPLIPSRQTENLSICFILPLLNIPWTTTTFRVTVSLLYVLEMMLKVRRSYVWLCRYKLIYVFSFLTRENGLMPYLTTLYPWLRLLNFQSTKWMILFIVLDWDLFKQ